VSDGAKLREIFDQNKISFEDYQKKPDQILQDPRLLIKLENDLYDWKSAAPLIVSLLAFRKPLP
jgi:hypothetical protein